MLRYCLYYLLFWLLGISVVAAAELTFTPAAPVVTVGEEVSLTVAGATGAVTWSAQKGWIVGVEATATYQAPDQAGFDVVTVSDAAGNIGTLKVQIVAKSNISQENAVWEIFVSRNGIRELLLSKDGNTLWVGTEGGLEKRDAQTGVIQQVLTKLDGLPDNYVEALLSDGQGGLWVGMLNGGLAHYSAQGQWQVLNPDDSQLVSAFDLLNDGQDGLWIGAFTGHGRVVHYNGQGQWQVFDTENSGLPDDVINTLLSDNQGGLWVGTEQGGLAHYGVQGEWQVFNTDNSGLPDDYVHTLLDDGQSGLWVGTNQGLARYTAQGEWQVFNAENSGLPFNNIEVLLSDSQGGLWIGTWGGGLAHYTAQGAWQVFNKENSGLPDNNVSALLGDGEGGLWIGTWKGGLAHYGIQGEWQVFNNAKNSSLRSNQVEALSSDSQGGLWIGTWGGLAHRTIQGTWQVFNKENSGLPDDTVYTLLDDGQSGLWVGTYSGLARYTAQGEWQTFNTENSGLLNNSVYSLLSDGQGGLWVGTFRGGLVRYTAQGEWQVFNGENSGLPDNSVRTLLSDNQGGLWVGTWEGGLAHYTTQGEWQVFNKENSGLPFSSVRALLSDDQGGLWVGTRGGGLAHYTAQGEWQVFNEGNSGLPDNDVRSLLSDSQGGLWVGTFRGGLARYTAQEEWQVFNRRNSGLPGDTILSLLSDSQGGLWVGAYGGLAHLTFPEKRTGNRAAIIIASGGNHQENSLWRATEMTANYLYKMLAARKFVNEEIYYVSSKDWADFNGDGFNDRIVDAPRPERSLVADDIRQAFEWAKNRGKLDQPLYVFFMDHGYSDGRLGLDTDRSEYLQAEELKAILDDYQTATGSQVVLVIEACYSGTLLPILQAPNRAIITSASANERAYFDDSSQQGFSYFLAKILYKGFDFFDSFKNAGKDQQKLLGKINERLGLGETETISYDQTPQLDDNGDGLYDSENDGSWLKQIKINGDLPIAAADSFTVEALTSSTTLTIGQPIVLQAKISPATAEQVWAIVRPPRMNRVIDTNGTPILAFPRENLYLTAEKEIYQTTWNNAVYNGDYEITFYAKDRAGNIVSSDTSITITVSGGIDPPSQAQVQIHLEKDRYQRGESFKATLTEDLGWGYDLYAAVVLPDGNFITLNGTNNLRPVNEAKPWYAQRSPGNAITLFDLTLPADLPTGQYCLYGILSPEQNNVFETKEKGLWVYGSQCFEVF